MKLLAEYGMLRAKVAIIGGRFSAGAGFAAIRAPTVAANSTNPYIPDQNWMADMEAELAVPNAGYVDPSSFRISEALQVPEGKIEVAQVEQMMKKD